MTTATHSHLGVHQPENGKQLSYPERPTTDLGNAERFVDQFGDELRYCHPWRKWLVWDGRRWAVDQAGEALWRAQAIARSIYDEASAEPDSDRRKTLAQWAVRSESKDRLAAMVDLARPLRPILPSKLDRDPWLCNVLNGTLDLRIGELREHRRSDYITQLCPTPYIADAQCPLWEQFLDRIFDNNTDLIGYVQRLLGYCLTGDTSEHILPIFWGTGANGKSTLINAMIDMLGRDYAMKAPPDLLMTKRNETHPTERADLFGKRFVACLETAENRRLADALVKDLTGGDRVRARRMREDFWEFAPTHKIVLATNHRPTIRDTTHAMWRRVKLVPFTVTIPDEEQDKHLPEKLRAEHPGILAWCVRGLVEWKAHGLGEPNEVRIATSDYRAEQDLLGCFLEERCMIADSYQTRASDLYSAYCQWCEDGGERAVSQRRFGMALTERGLERYKGTDARSWWSGVTLA